MVRRGYNRKKVSGKIDRAFKSFYSKSIITPSVEEKKPKHIYFTVQYHPGLPDIKGILKKYLPLLHLSSRMREAVPELPIVSFRQPSNLKNLLVRAKVKDPSPKGEPSRPCYRGKTKPCQLCSKLVANEIVTSTANRRNFHCFNENTTCSSKWVIYLISCPVCFKQYVGQTNDLRLRINAHKSNLKKFRDGKALPSHCTELYKHLSIHSPGDFFVQILDKINTDNFLPRETATKLLEKELDLREKKWIWRLETLVPKGLNMNDGFNCHTKNRRTRHV